MADTRLTLSFCIFSLYILSVLCLKQVDTENLNWYQCTAPSCKGGSCSQTAVNITQCYCDSDCQVYGDCCYDFEKYCQNSFPERKTLQTVRNHSYPLYQNYSICYNLPIGYFRIIGKCPNVNDDIVKKRCEDPNAHPYGNVPVSIKNITFRNIFCARCHDAHPFKNGAILWKSQISCPFVDPTTNLSDLSSKLQDGTCNIWFNIPQSLQSWPRRCLPEQVHQQCAENSRTHDSEKCGLYQRVVRDRVAKALYKNPHCAACSNRLPADNVSIVEDVCRNIPLKNNNVGGFGFIFDLTGSMVSTYQKIPVSKAQSCGVNEVYNVMFDMCSRIFCPFGFMPVNSSCVSRHNQDPSRLYRMNIVYDSIQFDDDTWELLTYFHNITNNISCNIEIYKTEQNLTQNGGKALEVLFRANCSLISLTYALRSYVEDLKTMDSVVILKVDFRTPGPCPSVNDFLTLDDFMNNKDLDDNNIPFKIFLYPTGDNNIYICTDLPNCTSIKYQRDQFTINHGVVQIVGSDQIFAEQDYVMYQNSVFVCTNQSRFYVDEFWKHFWNLTINSTFSVVIISISIVSCLLTLTVYMILPHLRNGPGLIVMSLTLSLCVAQLLSRVFIFSRGVYCFIFGAVVHTLWISVFLWKSVMMVDLAKSMWMTSKKSSSEMRTYGIYATIAWLCPAVVVSLMAVLDGFNIAYFGYGFAIGDVCWIQDPYVALYTLGIPMFVCVVINLVGFIFTLVRLMPRAQILGKAVHMERKKQLVKVFF